MEQEQRRVGVSKTRCPYCHDEVTRGVEPAVCVACHALHHEACMIEHGVCATCAAPHPRLGEARAFRRTIDAGAGKDSPFGFWYEAVNGRGSKVSGVVVAQDRDDALTKVKGIGLFPTKLKRVPLVCRARGCSEKPCEQDPERCLTHAIRFRSLQAKRSLSFTIWFCLLGFPLLANAIRAGLPISGSLALVLLLLALVGTLHSIPKYRRRVEALRKARAKL